MKPTYKSYKDWRSMLTDTAGISLNADYCKERIAALRDEKDASTSAFLRSYGEQHRDQIVRWFEQAAAES